MTRCTAQVYIKSKVYNNSTASQYVQMLYGLLHDLLQSCFCACDFQRALLVQLAAELL